MGKDNLFANIESQTGAGHALLAGNPVKALEKKWKIILNNPFALVGKGDLQLIPHGGHGD
jgi:hypothetical protein